MNNNFQEVCKVDSIMSIELCLDRDQPGSYTWLHYATDNILAFNKPGDSGSDPGSDNHFSVLLISESINRH